MRKPFIITTFALGLLACKNRETTDSPPYGETAADQGQPVGEVVKDPQYGERVVVEGRVKEVFGPQTFTMKAPIFREDLLVVAPRELVIEALAAPDDVRVTGTVRKMVVSEIEREYAIDFDNAVEVKWEARPFVAAESLERMGGDGGGAVFGGGAGAGDEAAGGGAGAGGGGGAGGGAGGGGAGGGGGGGGGGTP